MGRLTLIAYPGSGIGQVIALNSQCPTPPQARGNITRRDLIEPYQ